MKRKKNKRRKKIKEKKNSLAMKLLTHQKICPSLIHYPKRKRKENLRNQVESLAKTNYHNLIHTNQNKNKSKLKLNKQDKIK